MSKTAAPKHATCSPGTHEIHPANPQQTQLSRPLRAARFPLPAPSALPMAFNTHSSARGSGLVQHVFRSPARLPAPAEAHGGACAAPPSEKRYSLPAIGLRMVAAANLVEVAALVGDTARATMLNALMGGQSLTATELAYCANVSRATASGHLSKLVAARLLTVTRERRFSYYRIASPRVATMLESMKVVAAIEVPPRRQPRSANDDALRFARSCYDHLAGQIGVAVADALVAMGHIVLTDEGGEVTSSGE